MPDEKFHPAFLLFFGTNLHELNSVCFMKKFVKIREIRGNFFFYSPNNSINSKARLVDFTFSKVNKSRKPFGVCFSFIVQRLLYF
jgi:hypothetical protein